MAYQDIDDDLRSPQGAFIARMDADKKNRENRSLYTDQEILEGLKFKDMVDSAFFRRRTFLNYRETFMTVKVEAPKKEDKISQEYRDVMSYAKARGFTVKQGRASIIFEFNGK